MQAQQHFHHDPLDCSYDRHFETILADTPNTKSAHYRLRYQVFCLETGFEDPGQFPDREERDEADGHAVHFLTRERAHPDWVAAVRLVLARDGELPLGGICKLDDEHAELLEDPRAAEVSRLSMVGSYRRRTQERVTACGLDSIDTNPKIVPFERRREPVVLLGMLRAALTYSRYNGVEKLFFLIRPALARVLSREGIPFDRAGPACEHRGLRYPYVADVKEGWRALCAHSDPDVRDMFAAPLAYRADSQLSEKPTSPGWMLLRPNPA